MGGAARACWDGVCGETPRVALPTAESRGEVGWERRDYRLHHQRCTQQTQREGLKRERGKGAGADAPVSKVNVGAPAPSEAETAAACFARSSACLASDSSRRASSSFCLRSAAALILLAEAGEGPQTC